MAAHSDGAPTFGVGAVGPHRAVRALLAKAGRTEFSIEWMPGRREVASARVTLHRKEGSPLPTIEFDKLFTFRMRGIGYMHPQFIHGSNHGELEVGGESIKLDDFAPLDLASIHIPSLRKGRMGDKQGVGVLEQLAFGPHEPTGLPGLLDGYSSP